MNAAWPLLQFALCAAVIGRAGYVLSASADRIARATGLGGGWVGLALLGTVTSLPELASGITAVTVLRAPNLAVGNALGACVFNLLFLVGVDALQRRQPIYRSASTVHLLTAAFGVVMLGFVAMSLLMAQAAPPLLHLGLYSPLLLGLYLLALKSVHAHEAGLSAAALRPMPVPIPIPMPMPEPEPIPEPLAAPSPTPVAVQHPAAAANDESEIVLHLEWRRFALAAAAVLAAGTWLPHIGDQLALTLGLSLSFAGTLFLALATTLPEVAVTLAALRLRALDMAIGNLLGSNLFNVTILAVDDAFYLPGPLLAEASPVHVGTAVTAVVMSALVMVGLLLRPGGRVLRVLSWVSVGLLAAWMLNALVVFLAAA